MEDRVNPRDDVIGEDDGFGLGLFGDEADFLEISIEEPVRVSCKSLLPEALLEASGPEPHPVQEFPEVEGRDSGERNRHRQDENLH